MKVSELIMKLSRLNPDAEVLTAGATHDGLSHIDLVCYNSKKKSANSNRFHTCRKEVLLCETCKGIEKRERENEKGKRDKEGCS